MPALSPAEAIMEALRIASAQAAASAKLRFALLTGTDTAGIRRELADLDRRVSELAAEQNEAAGLQEAARMNAIQRTAGEHAQRRCAAPQCPLGGASRAGIAHPLPCNFHEDPMIDPAIAAAAHGVAEAEADLQSASAKLKEVEKVAVRISALDGRRLDIVGRRQRGDVRPDDGATLETIRADQEGLQELLREAEAAVAEAKGPVETGKRNLANARGVLLHAEDRAAQTALTEHAGKLESLMLATVQQLAETQLRLGQPGLCGCRQRHSTPKCAVWPHRAGCSDHV